MTWLWLIVAFALGSLTCWWFSGKMLKLAFRKSMMVDIIKGLKTETVVKLRDEAEAEIGRRQRLLADKARAA